MAYHQTAFDMEIHHEQQTKPYQVVGPYVGLFDGQRLPDVPE
jgi:hypothetical protein